MTSTLVSVEYTKKRFFMAQVTGDGISYAKKPIGSFKMVDGLYEVAAYKNSKGAFELEDTTYSFGEEFIIARVKGLAENGTIILEGGDDFWDGATEGMGEYLRKKY